MCTKMSPLVCIKMHVRVKAYFKKNTGKLGTRKLGIWAAKMCVLIKPHTVMHMSGEICTVSK